MFLEGVDRGHCAQDLGGAKATREFPTVVSKVAGGGTIHLKYLVTRDLCVRPTQILSTMAEVTTMVESKKRKRTGKAREEAKQRAIEVCCVYCDIVCLGANSCDRRPRSRPRRPTRRPTRRRTPKPSLTFQSKSMMRLRPCLLAPRMSRWRSPLLR